MMSITSHLRHGGQHSRHRYVQVLLIALLGAASFLVMAKPTADDVEVSIKTKKSQPPPQSGKKKTTKKTDQLSDKAKQGKPNDKKSDRKIDQANKGKSHSKSNNHAVGGVPKDVPKPTIKGAGKGLGKGVIKPAINGVAKGKVGEKKPSSAAKKTPLSDIHKLTHGHETKQPTVAASKKSAATRSESVHSVEKNRTKAVKPKTKNVQTSDVPVRHKQTVEPQLKPATAPTAVAIPPPLTSTITPIDAKIEGALPHGFSSRLPEEEVFSLVNQAVSKHQQWGVDGLQQVSEYCYATETNPIRCAYFDLAARKIDVMVSQAFSQPLNYYFDDISFGPRLTSLFAQAGRNIYDTNEFLQVAVPQVNNYVVQKVKLSSFMKANPAGTVPNE